ncbi:MAG: phenylalanine--tRNA ligase subunit alpha [Actinomycetota bacterium]|nr:phenylalanine--tRNA ligase subunit alpha [Actinomycetota bacterium]
MSAVDRIQELRAEGAKAIASAADTAALEELRVRYLGRKSELTSILRGIADLPADERGAVGSGANQARSGLEAALDARKSELESDELEMRLAADAIDVTLPGTPPVRVGHIHPVTRTRREIEDIFVGLGYRVMDGPEVEHDFYNFTALNHPPGHPARMVQDTFYVDPASLADGIKGEGGLPPGPRDVLLRTHTSPNQVRAMETHQPPLFIIVPGTVYRRDTMDATHLPMFSQVEGLAVAEDITLADLAGTLQEVARALFGDERETRLKPDYFPFTEPSVQVDVSCFRCGGSGSLPGGERDGVCKGTGWIEILGAGMVDPNVFGFVAEHGYDPGRVQGFAFGMGIERIAFLKHGIPDLRMFYENDARFLGQFS